LRNRFKILAHDDVVVVCLSNNEAKAEILATRELYFSEFNRASRPSAFEQRVPGSIPG